MTAAAPFVHHVAMSASDFAVSEPIYSAALRALGVEALFRADTVAEYWEPDEDRLSFSLEQASRPETVTRRMHIGFMAADRAAVDRFHDAAVAAGARPKHAPRYWPEYRAYCAFLRDPDGNNVEALVKEPS
jgi:catechol 2,3-dioxygenase-like lactoylglutathione lyase family enzyme